MGGYERQPSRRFIKFNCGLRLPADKQGLRNGELNSEIRIPNSEIDKNVF